MAREIEKNHDLQIDHFIDAIEKTPSKEISLIPTVSGHANNEDLMAARAAKLKLYRENLEETRALEDASDLSQTRNVFLEDEIVYENNLKKNSEFQTKITSVNLTPQ